MESRGPETDRCMLAVRCLLLQAQGEPVGAGERPGAEQPSDRIFA